MIDEELTIGAFVETSATVLGERIPGPSGRVVEVLDGYARVDVMSHHGGAPWVTTHRISSLELAPHPQGLAKKGSEDK